MFNLFKKKSVITKEEYIKRLNENNLRKQYEYDKQLKQDINDIINIVEKNITLGKTCAYIISYYYPKDTINTAIELLKEKYDWLDFSSMTTSSGLSIYFNIKEFNGR